MTVTFLIRGNVEHVEFSPHPGETADQAAARIVRSARLRDSCRRLRPPVPVNEVRFMAAMWAS